MSKLLVSSQWLTKNIADENLVILDATQQIKRNIVNEKYQNKQIINSRCFDIKNDFSDVNSVFPNTFPSIEKFENSCRNLGISNSSIIVVYDALGVFSSARVWWMFKTLGHEKVYVLNGGLPDWINNGFSIEKIQKNIFKKGNFSAILSPENIWSFTDIKNNISEKKALVIDARSKERFQGLAAETRTELRSGNIPNSINITYLDVLDNGKFKSKEALKIVFSQIKTKQPLVFTCGSGITACIILLASEFVLNNKKAIYDGSWTEFGTLFKE